MNISRVVCALALGVTTLAPAGSARAAGAGDLQSPYNGALYRRFSTKTLVANTELNVIGPNGKVSGSFSGIPITGKITNKGKFTFSGQLSAMGSSVKVKQGKGQLSASGLFILGTAKVEATGPGFGDAGLYLFSLSSQSLETTLKQHGLGGQGGNGGLQETYGGQIHDNKNTDLERIDTDFQASAPDAKGKFTGLINGVPIKGKVTSNGKVTFAGKASGKFGTAKYQGSGLLDGSGLVFIGTVTVKGTGLIPNVKGTFELYSK